MVHFDEERLSARKKREDWTERFNAGSASDYKPQIRKKWIGKLVWKKEQRNAAAVRKFIEYI